MPESKNKRIDSHLEGVMGVKTKKVFPALKHGGYSTLGLLPGEDPAAFEELRRDMIAELCPNGPLEEDIVGDMVRFTWRKNNLKTFRVAEAIRKRYSEIRSKMIPSTVPPYDSFPDWTPPDPAQVKAATEAAEAQARKELGEYCKLIEMGDLATPARLLADLAIEERLDARIAKLFNRLAMLKTYKSVLSAKSPSSTELPRISGPKKSPNLSDVERID
jgi:hypothetical protein